MSRVRAWSGAVELRVRTTDGTELTALAYPALVGDPAPGDTVLLNVSAQVRGLGTGGYALVVARPDALPSDPEQGAGHLVKARYTPLQTMVLGVDEQESPYHEQMREADDLVAEVPVGMTAVDRRKCLLSLNQAGLVNGQGSWVVLEQPALAHLLTDAFDLLWESAEPAAP